MFIAPQRLLYASKSGNNSLDIRLCPETWHSIISSFSIFIVFRTGCWGHAMPSSVDSVRRVSSFLMSQLDWFFLLPRFFSCTRIISTFSVGVTRITITIGFTFASSNSLSCFRCSRTLTPISLHTSSPLCYCHSFSSLVDVCLISQLKRKFSRTSVSKIVAFVLVVTFCHKSLLSDLAKSATHVPLICRSFVLDAPFLSIEALGI